VHVVERAQQQAGREEQRVGDEPRVLSTAMSTDPDDRPIPERIAAIRESWKVNRQGVDVEALAARVADLEAMMGAPDFWDDPAAARKLSEEQARTGRRVERFRSLETDVADLDGLAELASEDPELVGELHEALASIEERLQTLEEERLFAGTYDGGDALVTVNAGAGGTDAQDWAEMVLRMEMLWAQKRGFKVELLEASDGDEAGVKSATFRASGENAYGLFGAEKGVHRLVRLSPFDSANRRQTSFAGLEVAPVIEDEGEIEISDDDLRVDTYRASGAGGQHVNKTDSAVRITHVPTNTVVQCQNERSQSANRLTAMKMLVSKLVERRERERAELLAKEKGGVQAVDFGSQIRSYVLHPYTMVKDHRTNHEVGDATRVLDGDLDGFVRSELLREAAERAAGEE
jgi:peptide chain release factor 2